MAEGDNKRDARSLVGSILAKTSAVPTLPDDSPLAAEAQSAGLAGLMKDLVAEPTQPSAETSTTTTDPHTLMALYFELEDAYERDVVFDQLIAHEGPDVDAFLRAMMDHDEDDYVRAAAAAELARRGDAAALAVIERDLAEPEEPYFFTHAVATLSALRGEAFYDTLLAIWQDETRDADERAEAMLALEALAPARALADFVRFIESQTDIDKLADDRVEAAMMAFVRHEHVAALPALKTLRQRIAEAQLDADERDELVGMLDEGIALLGES